LSSELAVSLIYSPGGQGWCKSQLGQSLGCVAVCQMIDDVSVKCTVKEGNTIREIRIRIYLSLRPDKVTRDKHTAESGRSLVFQPFCGVSDGKTFEK
jgi:hypothetical protein